jgi:hypothetical protein
MRHLTSLSFAVLGGALLGAAIHRLRWTPLLETTTIVVSASLLGSLVAAGAWLMWPPQGVDILAVSVGLLEALLAAIVVAVLGFLLHFGFAAAGCLRPGLADLRPAAVGIVGAIIGVLGFAGGWAVKPLV